MFVSLWKSRGRKEKRSRGRNGGNNVAESVSLVLWSTKCNGTSIQLQRREKSPVLHALLVSPSSPPPLPHPLSSPHAANSFVSSSYLPWSWIRFSRWNQPPPLDHGVSNGLWRHWTFRDVTLVVLNLLRGEKTFVTCHRPSLFLSTTNVSCHAIIYVYKLCRNETIEWSRWDRSIVSKGVSTLLRRHQFQEMSVVTETIKPKIDAPLRGHGPVTMGSRGIHKGIVKNEIFCYYYCYYYSTFN